MAKTIMITSGKGGVGKSTLALNLGKSLSDMGKTVVIVELDSGLRSLDIMFDVQDKVVYDLSDILRLKCRADQALICCNDKNNLFLISAPYSPTFIPEKEGMKKLIALLGKFCDYLILDTGAGLGNSFENVAPVCGMALVVVTPDPICVRDGKRAGDILIDKGIENVRLVINKVNLFKDNRIRNFDDIIDQTGLQLISVIPFDEGTILNNLEDRTFLLKKSINNLALRVVGEHIELAIK